MIGRTVFRIYYLFSVASWVNGLQIPDILWNPRSPMFNSTLCAASSTIFFAKLNDIIPILCPNMDLNNGFECSTPKSQYNYNIYMTGNIKTYETRNATMAIRIKNCKQKTVTDNKNNLEEVIVVKHNEFLREYAPMGGHKYQAGKTYYFFTTSNGTEASLKSMKGKNNSMGFEVHICGEQENCKPTSRTNLCIPMAVSKNGIPYQAVPARRIEKSDEKEDNNGYFKYTLFGLAIFLAFVLGLIFGICVMIIKRKRERKGVNVGQDINQNPIRLGDGNAVGTLEKQESVLSNQSSKPLLD